MLMERKICKVCGNEFIPRSSINTLCGNPLCKKINKYNRESKARKTKNVSKYGDDPNHSIEKLTKTCIFCGSEFQTHKRNMDSCCASKCSSKRAVILKKARILRLGQDEVERIRDRKRKYADVDSLSSTKQYYDAKCPMCKRKHKIRLDYGSHGGTLYKYCLPCKSRVEKVDESTMMFGYIPELEEMKYEPVRA